MTKEEFNKTIFYSEIKATTKDHIGCLHVFTVYTVDFDSMEITDRFDGCWRLESIVSFSKWDMECE